MKELKFRLRSVDFILSLFRRQDGTTALNEVLMLDPAISWQGIEWEEIDSDLTLVKADLIELPDGFDKNYIVNQYKAYQKLHNIKD